MEQLKVFYDRTGNKLTVWFGEQEQEFVCEETGDEVVLMKDRLKPSSASRGKSSILRSS